MTTLPSSSVNPQAPVNATPTDAAAKAAQTRDIAIEIARLLSDDKCTDIALLDVRGLTSVQDYVILASGTSDRQMRSAATDVKNMLPKLGSSVYRTSIDEQSTWIVVDCVDTVIHIFEPNTRSYYDLESMWGDAPKVEWLRAGQKPYTPGDDSEPLPARESAGDTDEPAPAQEPVEASEPDADTELTTTPAAEMLEEVRATVARPVAKSAKPTKAKPAAPAKKAASKPMKKAAKKSAAKKAAASKPAAAKPAKKVAKAGKKIAKPAAKKAAKPAKKAPAKPAKKSPAKKAAKRK